MTKVEYDGDMVEYDGDNPLRLANEIDAALAKYGRGSDHHMCKAIHFFEGELRLIAECLRCAGPAEPRKAAAQHSRSGHTGSSAWNAFCLEVSGDRHRSQSLSASPAEPATSRP